jgi:hypothetical protein
LIDKLSGKLSNKSINVNHERGVKEAQIGKAALTNHIMRSKAQFELSTISQQRLRWKKGSSFPLCN